MAQTSDSSRPYHHGSLRSTLVLAAAQLVSERGPAAVSLREVAARAGVSPAAPYHYFTDKAALLRAVEEDAFQLLDGELAATLNRSPDDPIERLRAVGVSYVRFVLDRPHYVTLMFRPSQERGKNVVISRAARRTFERIAETVRAARVAAGHDDDDPLAVMTMMWAVPHGLALLYVSGPLATETTPRALEDVTRAALTALSHAPLDELGRDGEFPWGV